MTAKPSPLPKLSDVERLRCDRAYAAVRDHVGGMSTASVAYVLRVSDNEARQALNRLAAEGLIVESLTRHKINLWRAVPHQD